MLDNLCCPANESLKVEQEFLVLMLCLKKKTKREEFLEIMDEIIPWEE